MGVKELLDIFAVSENFREQLLTTSYFAIRPEIETLLYTYKTSIFWFD